MRAPIVRFKPQAFIDFGVPIGTLGEHPYDDLKSALLRHYAPAEEEKLHQLLYQTTLSFEQKPSELLGKMRNLIGPNVVLSQRVLRKLFLDQMPYETRKMLSMHDSEDLDGFAKMADRIHENDFVSLVLLPVQQAIFLK